MYRQRRLASGFTGREPLASEVLRPQEVQLPKLEFEPRVFRDRGVAPLHGAPRVGLLCVLAGV